MSGTTPYAQCSGDAADACRDSAAEVGARLRVLRGRLATLDPARLRMTGARLEDLLAGFDIYARMLEDALHDIAGDLRTARRSEVEPAIGSLR